MTSATDELRRLLDERGVEWERGLPTETIVRVPIDTLYVERPDGRMHVYFRSYLTPEQAIAATLGRGTCRNISHKLGNDEFTCEECLARVYGSGGRWFDVNWEYHKFNYCPNCGREVVNEVWATVAG